MNKKIKYLPISLLTLTTVLAGVSLADARTFAATTGTKNVSVTVEPACTFTNSASSYSVSLSAVPGAHSNTEQLSKTAFGVACNDPNGFTVQAIGFSPDSTSGGEGVEGNTSLYGGADGSIATGTATSGPNSNWAFKISSATASGTTASIPSPYSDYAAVPDGGVSHTPVTVVSFAPTSSTDTVTGSVRSDYRVYAQPTQVPGTFVGGMKYYIVASS